MPYRGPLLPGSLVVLQDGRTDRAVCHTADRINHPVPQQGCLMRHGRFSGALLIVWLHSSCLGDMGDSYCGGCMSFCSQLSLLVWAAKRLIDHRSLGFLGSTTALVLGLVSLEQRV